MKTILFFQTSFCASNQRQLTGVYAFARKLDWNIQVVEYGTTLSTLRKPDIGALFAFWHPDGCIVDCGGALETFSLADFGRVPVVFVDRHPSTIERGALCVTSDSTANGGTTTAFDFTVIGGGYGGMGGGFTLPAPGASGGGGTQGWSVTHQGAGARSGDWMGHNGGNPTGVYDSGGGGAGSAGDGGIGYACSITGVEVYYGGGGNGNNGTNGGSGIVIVKYELKSNGTCVILR